MLVCTFQLLLNPSKRRPMLLPMFGAISLRLSPFRLNHEFTFAERTSAGPPRASRSEYAVMMLFTPRPPLTLQKFLRSPQPFTLPPLPSIKPDVLANSHPLKFACARRNIATGLTGRSANQNDEPISSLRVRKARSLISKPGVMHHAPRFIRVMPPPCFSIPVDTNIPDRLILVLA